MACKRSRVRFPSAPPESPTILPRYRFREEQNPKLIRNPSAEKIRRQGGKDDAESGRQILGVAQIDLRRGEVGVAGALHREPFSFRRLLGRQSASRSG
jgi:hypothetical protein